MKVLVDGLTYDMNWAGGINRYFTEILSRMGREPGDIRISIALPHHSQGQLPSGEHIRLLPEGIYPPWWLAKKIHKARARAERPEVFHTTYYTYPHWPGMKRVVTVYDYIYEKLPAIMGNAQFVEKKQRVIEQSDAVIAISRCTREDVVARAGVDPARVSVICPAVSEAFLSGAVSPEERQAFGRKCGVERPYWLYVGRRGKYKNFGVLLRAFARSGAKTGASLVLIGGELELEASEIDFMIRHRIEERVHLCRYANDDDLRAAYADALALVVPSLAEGFGIPLLEAMACGTPVIASDIPAFREVAGDASRFFDPHDDEELAVRLAEVLEPSTRASLVDKGRRRAGDFSWDVAARKTAGIYRSLVGH